MNELIDIVVPWVDGDDPQWQREKLKYEQEDASDSRDIRYRDWDIFHFWFRGIEKNCPWVNKVHLITYGHVPNWLNIEHPKLNIVTHKDFIPEEYLPTFSSHVIELNLHRIKNLSEKFIYFNDDIYVLRKTEPSDFFEKGLPKDYAVLRPLLPSFRKSTAPIESNNLEIINTKYSIWKSIKENPLKWINYKYGKHLISTILQLPYKKVPGFLNLHLPNSFLKSTLKELWNEEKEILHETCLNKFRDGRDVNQWLIRYKQLLEGKFIPQKTNIGKTYSLSDNNDIIYSAIVDKKHQIICINDNGKKKINDLYKEQTMLVHKFLQVFPNKSTYEK